MSPHPDNADTTHTENNSTEPTTGTAAVVAAIWCELFGVPRVGPHDDFFALGGHSMLGVRMASRLRAELGLRVPVRTILENPTLQDLSQLLDEALQPTPDPVGD
ncbi:MULTISPECIES: phosphopantetheine-binding protein [Streptomyces]|uniref:Carrier domain-containing protein n=1 Tax=Streptomyces cadmiisoli TaxID=2184053 RepID=A0A2Z4IRU9_9ACTN|nr:MULTISPECIES: phosphopantetheine-binding protein [Streptomyces]AWW35494.1 hypothetical protein DN051_01415 [Streptomyces cadmiisoli]KOV54486.1 hypothetical protein ADL00_30725 [Streptomyces sp. AS58]